VRSSNIYRNTNSKTNGFDQVLTSDEISELVLVYTILLNEKNFKEFKGILKFIRVKKWILLVTPIKIKIIENKTSDSKTSS